MWQLRIYDMKHFWDNNYHLMELVKEVAEEPDKGILFMKLTEEHIVGVLLAQNIKCAESRK